MLLRIAPFLVLFLISTMMNLSGEEGQAKGAPAPKRSSANGKEVPAGAHVSTFRVWCYTSGKKALSGQPGVLEIVKAIRKRPFAEWVIVYFNSEAISDDDLLKRLRSHGCKKATQEMAKAVVEEGVKVSVANPICVSGDVVQCTVQFPEGEPGKVRVAPPPEWIPLPLAKKAEDGLLRLDIQSPRKARPGRTSITILVTPDGKKERAVKVPVDLVSLVPNRGR